MIVHVKNVNTWEAEAGGLRNQDRQPGLPNKITACLYYMSKKKKTKR